MIDQTDDELGAELHLVGKLLDRLRPRLINMVPNITAKFFVFVDVHYVIWLELKSRCRPSR